MKNKIEEIKEKLLKRMPSRVLTPDDYLSTGSTLLNLAITGHPDRGFAKGHYYRFVGDSASGKTWLCLTCFAEAVLNPNFQNHRLIYDDVEGGALMDMKRFFGKMVAEKIEPPRLVNGEPVSSRLVEDFYYHLDDAIKDGRPFIYVLDSMDGVSCMADETKFDENKNAYRKGRKHTGSMGMAKARKNSGDLNRVIGRIKGTDNILIIISQTRDSTNIMSYGGKSASGGHSLKFYAGLEIWSSVKQQIEKIVRGKKRQIGTLCKLRVKKNRISGRDRTVFVQFYHSYGLDDIGTLIDFLCEEEQWKVRRKEIDAKEFDFVGKREALIKHIEQNGLEKKLRELTTKVWQSIEDACTVKRKPRY